jgi:hypothetical protein
MVALVLTLSLIAVAVAGACGGNSRPGSGGSGAASSPREPVVKVCPASSRYNPKTHRCERIRF